MGAHTTIEYCDTTVSSVMGCDGCELWNPVKKVEHCYAGQLHKLRAGLPGYADDFNVPKLFPGRVQKAAALKDLRGTERPDKPWLNGLPRIIFFSDMGDALSKSVPLEFLRDEVLATCQTSGRRHIWLWLTKQPQRMVKLAELVGGWPDNVWAGTSVTSMEQTGRLGHLLRVPAKVHYVSYEPALGPVDFTRWLPKTWCDHCYPGHGHDPKEHRKNCRCRCHGGLKWAIVGGESGSGARPFNPAWADDIVTMGRQTGVAVFVKQMGSNPTLRNGSGWGTIRDRKGGREMEWPAQLRVRQMPAEAIQYGTKGEVQCSLLG